MQFKFFLIPVMDAGESSEELNRFLRSHRVLEESHELVTSKNGSFLHFCIKYLHSSYLNNENRNKVKVDYQKVLSVDDFKKFMVFKKIRKSLAEHNAIPAYAVFTDKELAEICRLEKLEIQEIAKIAGIGKSKVENYAKIMISRFNEQVENEKSKSSL